MDRGVDGSLPPAGANGGATNRASELEVVTYPGTLAEVAEVSE
jgi:hypothetical protein